MISGKLLPEAPRKENRICMKSFIFDIDGTMFLNRRYHILAWKKLLTGKYEREFTDREFSERMFGPPNLQIIDYLFNGRIGRDEAWEMGQLKERLFREVCRETPGVALTEGLPALLDELSRLNIPRNIATGAPKANLDFYNGLFGLDRWFDMDRVIFDDGHMPGKPAPEIYLRACRAIGSEPADCIVFEDAYAGLESARRAGIGTIVMIDSSIPARELSEMPGVTRVIHDFTDRDAILSL